MVLVNGKTSLLSSVRCRRLETTRITCASCKVCLLYLR